MALDRLVLCGVGPFVLDVRRMDSIDIINSTEPTNIYINRHTHTLSNGMSQTPPQPQVSADNYVFLDDTPKNGRIDDDH
jgi:hypothetical protein